MDDRLEERRVELAPELAAAVDEAVAAGEYASPSAVISEALGEWKERRENHGYTIAELRAEIQKGIESGVSEQDGEEFLQGLQAKYQAMVDSTAR